MRNIKYMDYMFYNCSSLNSIFDISKWNISNNIKIDNIFDNCISLNNSSILNFESYDNILSSKLKTSLNNNNSEKSLFDSNGNKENNNMNFIDDPFYELNENKKNYDNFYQ